MSERKFWLGLLKLQGIGPILMKKLLDFFPSAEAIWRAGIKELSQVDSIGKVRSEQIIKDRQSIDLDYELEQLAKRDIKYLVLSDEDYPFLLKNIYDPPPVLFYKGNFKSTDVISLSIVGSRKCTNYGRKIATSLASKLAKQGFTIVSGLARGIDSCGHRGALQTGRTIAVLGSGIDVIYPPENKGLVEQILSQDAGAIVSSFPLSTPPHGGNFPKRNRIISGLSLGTIVVEATEKSGSLITANLALNQGREVFAIPGDITREQSVGTNSLLKVGAKPVQSLEDILVELPVDDWLAKVAQNDKDEQEEVSPVESMNLTAQETKVYNQLSREAQQFDDILTELSLSAGELNSILLKLELKGVVEQLPGNKFSISD
ncbi:DNA-processing protein DprA [Fuchsiella alkaliacetigena]|uniref:DNA-processing protein DprA n=1 Tax=Fuchsiella alkaliacetigena TaxID=957042 RepID=UPI00200AEAAE|nr:DNA-processing protein DprA [Fuchsiella alkaliacetigena]MCK8823564.1 DNA-processing protein DprA [Fuchsiella alkaliacetigena]